MSDRIRIFVGMDPNDCDLEQAAVFAYTAHLHASMPLEITWMRLTHDKSSHWALKKWATAGFSTPFTAFRWGVPAACAYEGKAIYCDVDQWWQRDPALLWNHPIKPGCVLLNKANEGKVGFSVMLMDCAAMKPHIQSKPSDPKFNKINTDYFRRNNHLVDKWDSSVIDWNVCDGSGFADINDERVGLVHVTKMGTQPSHEYALPRLAREGKTHWYDGKIEPHPRVDIREKFRTLLLEAQEAGFKLDRYRNTGSPVVFGKKSYRGR